MVDAIGQKVFTKAMTTTDLGQRFHWPTVHKTELPNFNGGHTVEFTIKDAGGTLWNMKCSKRTTGLYHKTVVSTGWVRFIKSKEINLKVGDEVIFYRSLDPRALFEIRIKRKLLIFGYNVNNAEI